MLRQTPDDKGFITVNWPSGNVPHGGVFHAKKIDGSNADYLKLLIQESKMASELRQRRPWVLRDTSGERRLAKPCPESRQEEARRQPRAPRPRTSKRRSFSAIRQSGIFDADPWRPTQRGEDREMLKKRLQELMEWGSKEPDRPQLLTCTKENKSPALPTSTDIRQELLTQIRERAEWLQDMETLGQAAPHRDLIRDQIAERMRRLDDLRQDVFESEMHRSSVRGAGAGAGSLRGAGAASLRSTLRDRESVRSRSRWSPKAESVHTVHTANMSVRPESVYSAVTKCTARSATKKTSAKGSISKNIPAKKEAEENIAAVNNVFTPLGLTPRRRS